MAALNGLTHHPPEDAACYTPGGAQGAGSSNLALGADAAGSVDLYVADHGVPSLGHRRWVLNPSALVTAFGAKGQASCMYSFSMERRHDVAFVAWPPPGPMPIQAALGELSVSLYGVRPGPDFAIEVAWDDGLFEAVAVEALPGGFGAGSAYRFGSGAGARWQPGHSMHVALRGLGTSPDIEYTVELVDCSGR